MSALRVSHLGLRPCGSAVLVRGQLPILRLHGLTGIPEDKAADVDGGLFALEAHLPVTHPPDGAVVPWHRHGGPWLRVGVAGVIGLSHAGSARVCRRVPGL